MEALSFLTRITVLLVIGLFMGLIAKRVKLPSMLLLILAGVLLNNFTLSGKPLMEFNSEFLISASMLALIIVLFKDSSLFTLRDLDTYSSKAFKLAVIVLLFNVLFLSLATFMLFSLQSIILCIVFSVVMSGTDPGAVLSLFGAKNTRVIEIIKFESVVNTPIIVLIPFLLVDLMSFGEQVDALEVFFPMVQQIITGIGAGVTIGVVVFRAMRHFYSEQLSPLILVTTALSTYILAEHLGGNGILGVSVLGVFFGNIRVMRKDELQSFSKMLSDSLEIIMFILIGFLIPLSVEFIFLLKSIMLFAIMILVRYAAIQLVFFNDSMTHREKIFMALNCAKGITVAVVAFMLSSVIIGGSSEVFDLIVLFIIYSIVLASITARFLSSFQTPRIVEKAKPHKK